MIRILKYGEVSNEEIFDRSMPTVNVAEYRKKVDALSRDLRELDLRIQQLNWTTDLM